MKSCAIFTGITSVVRALNERECGASWSASSFDQYFSIVLAKILTKFLKFSSTSKAPYLRPISARDTGDMRTKFAQATYGNLKIRQIWNGISGGVPKIWMDGFSVSVSKIQHGCRFSIFCGPQARRGGSAIIDHRSRRLHDECDEPNSSYRSRLQR